MKLMRCDGNELTVRDLGPVLLTLRRAPGGPPIRRHGTEIMEDDTARRVVRELLDTEMYIYERDDR